MKSEAAVIEIERGGMTVRVLDDVLGAHERAVLRFLREETRSRAVSAGRAR